MYKLAPALLFTTAALFMTGCSDARRLYDMFVDIGSVDQLADGSLRTKVTLEQGIEVPSKVTTSHSIQPNPLPRLPMPDHPYMLDEYDSGGVHADSYNSSVSHHGGPVGYLPKAYAPKALPGNELALCTPMLRDLKNRLASACIALDGPSQLTLFDPENQFNILAQAEIPPRNGLLDPAGGWYSRMDNRGRVIVPTPAQDIRLYSVNDTAPDNIHWQIDKRWDISGVLEEGMSPLDVVPDWQGNYWFMTGYGQLGHLNTTTSQTQVVYIGSANGRKDSQETIGAALSVTEEAAFVHSSKAIYRMEISPEGKIIQRWLWKYGVSDSDDLTAPTLFDQGRLMAIGLNGTEQSPDRGLLVVLKTSGEPLTDDQRVVCQKPLFKPGRSELRNTMVGYDRSLLIQNNAGGEFFDLGDFEPGTARVDVSPDHKQCQLVWENYQVTSQTPPRLSTADGVLYQYGRRPGLGNDIHAWYLSALDYRTGSLVKELFVGSGKRLDNPMLSINFLPGRKLVSGTRNGIVTLEDSQATLKKQGLR